MTGCACQLAGHCDARRTIRCDKHGVVKGVREQQICNGSSGLPERDVAAWLAKWERRNAADILEERTPKTHRRSVSMPPGPPATFECEYRSQQPLAGEPLATVCRELRIAQDSDGHPLCDLCGGGKNKPIEIWGCSKHGHCTVTRKHSTVRSVCSGCSDCTSTSAWLASRRRPESPLTPHEKIQHNLAMIRAENSERTHKPNLIGQPINHDKIVRHMLYHVMPLAGDAEWVWRRQLDWLREARPQFNGRLLVGVLTQGRNDPFTYAPPEAVAEALAGLDAEVIARPNDRPAGDSKGIGEGHTFREMLTRIKTTDPDEIFVYGHTKAVTHWKLPQTHAPHLWAEVMFTTTFGNANYISRLLDRAGVAGPFRSDVPIDSAPWHFSGTFFAARCCDVFRRDWQTLPLRYGCVEQWPGLLFHRNRHSVCVFRDRVGNLYDQDYWMRDIWPEYQRWKAANATR